ncbi:hypothetical protein Tco_0770287 [Tanacetum coccineum]|uniref:Uncharacterized protein n=1 Tax=Tanacetum coccineum TaxID=301880 RepID=A0ABQ4ZD11_9ASTR
MSMKIHSSIKARILEAQSEASKGANTSAEMLKGLDKQFEKKEDGGLKSSFMRMLDTAYGRRVIRRIGNWLYAFSCEELALMRRISFVDTAYWSEIGNLQISLF